MKQTKFDAEGDVMRDGILTECLILLANLFRFPRSPTLADPLLQVPLLDYPLFILYPHYILSAYKSKMLELGNSGHYSSYPLSGLQHSLF